MDSAALRPVVHAQFREVVKILQKRKNELQQLGKSTVEACLRSGEDKDLEYCRNFLRRKKDTLTIAEQQELTSLEEENLCLNFVRRVSSFRFYFTRSC